MLSNLATLVAVVAVVTSGVDRFGRRPTSAPAEAVGGTLPIPAERPTTVPTTASTTTTSTPMAGTLPPVTATPDGSTAVEEVPRNQVTSSHPSGWALRLTVIDGNQQPAAGPWHAVLQFTNTTDQVLHIDAGQERHATLYDATGKGVWADDVCRNTSIEPIHTAPEVDPGDTEQFAIRYPGPVTRPPACPLPAGSYRLVAHLATCPSASLINEGRACRPGGAEVLSTPPITITLT